jgi:hypothetical protein
VANSDEQRFGKERKGEGRPAKMRAEGERAEQMIGENRTDGPSGLTDVDRDALAGPKSEWQEASAPAAGDPVSEDELRGLSLLGGSSVRGGALPGVSDPVRDGTGGPHERPGEAMGAGGQRRNPPLVEDAGMGDGGISMSGGAAGGERGHAGSSNRADPSREGDAGPGQHKASSRFDLDHPTDDGR